jgi:hypothetical protein
VEVLDRQIRKAVATHRNPPNTARNQPLRHRHGYALLEPSLNLRCQLRVVSNERDTNLRCTRSMMTFCRQTALFRQYPPSNERYAGRSG